MQITAKPSQDLQVLIVDDHQFILGGTVGMIQARHPTANILTAANREEALTQAQQSPLNLAVVDLSIPNQTGQSAQIEHGLMLIESFNAKLSHSEPHGSKQ